MISGQINILIGIFNGEGFSAFQNIRGTIYRLYNSFSTLHNEKDNASIHLKYILIVEFIVLQEKPGSITRSDTQ